MVKKIFLLVVFISSHTYSQNLEPVTFFSQAIGKNIKSYRIKSKKAYADKDFVRAEFLFDSLVKNVVNGSKLDNFKIRKPSGRQIEFHDFKKPIFLKTYASWCTPGAGEIPALNAIAKEYSDEIDFVVLFWDSKEKVKKASKKYSRKVKILYVDEIENKNDHVVGIMKHSLGLPTTFFVDENKMIKDVRRSVLHAFDEDYSTSYELNYNAYLKGISLLKGISEKEDIGAKAP